MSVVLSTSGATRGDWIAWAVAAALLVLCLKLHLLPALLAGLTIFCLVNLLVPRLIVATKHDERRRWIAVALVSTLVISLLTVLGVAVASFLKSSDESIPALFHRMAEIIEQSRGQLPDWVLSSLPDTAEELRTAAVEWLRSHARTVQTASTEFLRAIAQMLIGMGLGAMLALKNVGSPAQESQFAYPFVARARRMTEVFQRVVFAQVWISAINTLLTWTYLGLILPGFDINLPLVKTLVALTFLAGLMPILGNLISNTAIFIVSLSHSLLLSVVSLAYLVVIHKLEYFLNARIIGSHIRARAWELLLAMLVMEAAFGVPGLIIAPMAYAFFKDEFRDRNLV